MKKRFLVGILLAIMVFLCFVLIRENAKKYNLQKYNVIKNYNFIK